MKYLGIDLGGTNVAAAVVDSEGTILGKVSLPAPDGAEIRKWMRRMNDFVERANEAISNMAAQPHKCGDLVSIYIPVPHGLEIGNSYEGIDLDNVRVTPVSDGVARGADGKLLFDASKIGADLYLVEGNMKR